MIHNNLMPFCFRCDSYLCACGIAMNNSQGVISGYGGSSSIANHVEMTKAKMQAYMHELSMQNNVIFAELEPKRTNKKLLLLRRKA